MDPIYVTGHRNRILTPLWLQLHMHRYGMLWVIGNTKPHALAVYLMKPRWC